MSPCIFLTAFSGLPPVLPWVGKSLGRIKPLESIEMVWQSHHNQSKRHYIGISKLKFSNAVSVWEFDWLSSCRGIDAMEIINPPFVGQQELNCFCSPSIW